MLEKEAKGLDDNLLTKILRKVYQEDLNVEANTHEIIKEASELYANISEKLDLHIKYCEDETQQKIRNYIQTYFTIVILRAEP